MRTKQQNMKKKLNTRLRRCQLMMSFLSLVTIISLASASIFGFSNTHAVTFESEQGVAFTFNPTVTISITGGTGATNDGLTITNLTPGDVKDSNIITVSASANTPLGYSLSSTVGSSTYNTTELRKDGTSTTNKFTNLTANVSSLSNFSDNTWGYSYSTDSGSTWISGDITSPTATGYNGLPIYTTSSPIKLINSSTAGSSSIQFKIGAKASTSQIAGTYNNVINFIGTSKVVTTTYTINYNDLSGEADPTTMPTPNPLQGTDTTGNAAVKISSNVPVRENYMFKGWCTSQTSDDTCSSDVVQPGGYVALNPGTSSTTATVNKTIYAMWKSNLKMQNLDPSKCTTTATTVIDNRDGEEYLIQRLADGKCWMLDNLRLDLTNSTILNGLTTSNTHVDSASLTSLKSGNRSAGAQYASSGFVKWDSSTPSNTYNKAKANADYKDTTTTSYGDGSGKIGVYYNYCAASAGSYCYDQSAGTGNASYDLCPAGWRMPTGGSSGEYQTLYIAYSSSVANFQSALSTPLSGYYDSGSVGDQGVGGRFWSSSYYDNSHMYRLYVVANFLSPMDNVHRGGGYSVRCLLGS